MAADRQPITPARVRLEGQTNTPINNYLPSPGGPWSGFRGPGSTRLSLNVAGRENLRGTPRIIDPAGSNTRSGETFATPAAPGDIVVSAGPTSTTTSSHRPGTHTIANASPILNLPRLGRDVNTPHSDTDNDRSTTASHSPRLGSGDHYSPQLLQQQVEEATNVMEKLARSQLYIEAQKGQLEKSRRVLEENKRLKAEHEELRLHVATLAQEKAKLTAAHKEMSIAMDTLRNELRIASERLTSELHRGATDSNDTGHASASALESATATPPTSTVENSMVLSCGCLCSGCTAAHARIPTRKAVPHWIVRILLSRRNSTFIIVIVAILIWYLRTRAKSSPLR